MDLQTEHYKAGDVVQKTAGSAITAGAPQQVAGLTAIPGADIAASAEDGCQIGGVVKGWKITGAIAVGTDVGWDADADPLNGTAGSGAWTSVKANMDYIGGVCVEAAGASDEGVAFLLNRPLTVQFPAAGGAPAQGLIGGQGTAADPSTSATAGNFLEFRMSNSAATGTVRGLYHRLYLTGGAGGEAVRAFTTVSDDTPADTVNGAHLSLNFGASDGNVTGLGTAARCTLHVPNRSLGGTVAAVQAEAWADGASSAATNWSLIRAVLGGNATGAATLQTGGKLFDLEGLGSAGTGKIFHENTAADATHGLRIDIDGTAYSILLTAAPT